MRTIVIGDVHGCLAEFQALLRLVSHTKGSDRLVLVGDLMDRGPDPAGCVRVALEAGAEAVLSNHEEKHTRWRKHEKNRAITGKKNPMKAFSDATAAQHAALSDADIEWFESLPLMLEVAPNLVVVHAGLESAFSVQDQSQAVIRVRYVDNGARGKLGKMVGSESMEQPPNTHNWSESWKGPQSVVYGHAVHSMTDPRVDEFPGGKCYGIDTGCVFGGRLTAMVIVPGREPEFAQVQAQKPYFSYDHRREEC